MNEIYIHELRQYQKEDILDLINKDSFTKLIEYDIIKRDEDIFKEVPCPATVKQELGGGKK